MLNLLHHRNHLSHFLRGTAKGACTESSQNRWLLLLQGNWRFVCQFKLWRMNRSCFPSWRRLRSTSGLAGSILYVYHIYICSTLLASRALQNSRLFGRFQPFPNKQRSINTKTKMTINSLAPADEVFRLPLSRFLVFVVAIQNEYIIFLNKSPSIIFFIK